MAEETDELVYRPGESDEDYLKRIRADFKMVSDFESAERQKMSEDLEFVRIGGDKQWPDYAVQDRRKVGAERPMLTDNRVRQYRNSVVNQIRSNTPAIKVRPVDDQADVKTADILQGLIRNIEALSKADNAKDKAVEYAIDCGRGYFGLMTKYVNDDSWDQDIAFRMIPDPFKVYVDPFSVEVDGSDARWAFIVEDIPRRQFVKDYPDIDLADWDEGASGDLSGWVGVESIRIAEHFEVIEEPMELLMLADWRTVWADDYEKETQEIGEQVPIKASRLSKKKRCIWSKILGNKRQETRELPTEYVPVIPVYGEEFWHEGEHHISGLIRPAKDSQRLFNFWLSCVAEQVSLQPRTPFIAPEGSFEGHPEWKSANSTNFAYLEYRPVTLNGQVMAGPSKQPPPPVPAGYVEQMQVALDGIKAAVGMQNPAVGAEESANQSGKAIRSLQAQAAIGTNHFADNLAKSVEHAGRIIIDMIPRVYDTKRVLRILGEDGDATQIQHDPNQPMAMQQMQNPFTGEIKAIYNLGVGRYDVRVTAGPSYGTKRQEGFDALTQMMQQMPQLGQVAGDLVVRLSDSPYADEMADRLKAILPPPVQAVIANEDQDPQVIGLQQQLQMMQQQMSQAMQHMQQLEQQLQDKSGEMQLKQQDMAMRQQEYQLKSQQLQIDGFEAQTKRIEAEYSHQSTMMQNQMAMDQAARPPEPEDPTEARNEAQEAQILNGIVGSLGNLNRQIQEGQSEIEALQQIQSHAHAEALQGLAQLASQKPPATVGIRAVRGPDGRLIGGVKVKEDGSEQHISFQ